MTEEGATTTSSTALSVPHLVELITTVGSPVAVGTALLYYFGWVRTVIQARTLGYDASLAGLTVEDYLLKSINVLFLPIVGVLLLAVGLAAVHQHVMTQAEQSPTLRAWLLRFATAIRYLWVLVLPISLVFTVLRLPGAFYAVPTSLLFAMLLVLYGVALRKRLGGTPSNGVSESQPLSTGIGWWIPEDSQPSTNSAVPMSRVGRALVITLLLLAMFWETERFARTTGEVYAKDIIARPQQLAAVTILSTKRLAINGPCVDETAIAKKPDAYRFKYGGLRLLEATSDRYFVIAVCPQQTKVYMLHDSEDLLLEFSSPSGGQPPAGQ